MITKQTRWIALVALAATLCAVTATEAQALGQHPALQVNRAAPTIDPSTFIVAHPAQVTLRGGHAGYEHPALSARPAHTGGIDTNTFLVQPPATTTWTHDAAAPAVLAANDRR